MSTLRRGFCLCALLVAVLVPVTVAAQVRVAAGLLTNSSGMTLYVFDNDATVPGKSACIGACLAMWTPLYAAADDKASGDYSTITRDDGKLQWTYKGRPLYLWWNDKKPGDMDGDGLRKAWHVARP